MRANVTLLSKLGRKSTKKRATRTISFFITFEIPDLLFYSSYLEGDCSRKSQSESDWQVKPQTLSQQSPHHRLRQRHDNDLQEIHITQLDHIQ